MVKRKFKVAVVLAGVICAMAVVLVLFSFTSENQDTAKQFMQTELTLLNKSLAELDAISEMYKTGSVEVATLQESVTRCRLQYKRVEFYLAFYYPEFIKTHINGAPLLQLEIEGTKASVLPPQGLQVIDEMVFGDEVFDNRDEIFGLSRQLYANFMMLHGRLLKSDQAEWSDIEAMRLQLVRIFSLGVTGFDTPGSLNALEEAAASLSGMQQYFINVYGNTQEEEKMVEVRKMFDDAISFVSLDTAFEDFDRLTFLKTYLDPLYKKLGQITSKYPSDVLGYTAAWNSGSESVFAANFLNPYAFTGLKKEEDSKELRELGKMLFYDPKISGNGGMSCATCHQPDKAFTDGLPKSASNVQGKTVLRNAPTLLNAVYADRYFYDLRAFTLEQQAEHVIFNPDEFNTAYSAIVRKLQADKEYARLFKKVFGNGDITRDRFSKALASYVLSLQSFNSDFDKYVRGEMAELPEEVKRGFNLFTGKASCATCHFAPTFSGLVPPLYNENESEILGVLGDNKAVRPVVDTDPGRLANHINTEEAYIYEKSFKTTTVRNAGLTAPYFHNGAYATLEEVIDFYDQGGGGGMGLQVTNQTLPEDALHLTEQEKKDLIAFIKSLSDNTAGKNSSSY